MIQDCQLGAGGKDKKGVEVDPRRLSSHTAIIEQLILRADQESINDNLHILRGDQESLNDNLLILRGDQESLHDNLHIRRGDQQSLTTSGATRSRQWTPPSPFSLCGDQ